MGSTVTTTQGDLACAHSGKRTLAGLSEKAPVKLTVGKAHAVIVEDAATTGTYLLCTQVDGGGNPHPCNTTTVGSGGAAKLTAGGRPLLLDSDSVTSANDLQVTGTVTVHTGQSTTRLTAS